MQSSLILKEKAWKVTPGKDKEKNSEKNQEMERMKNEVRPLMIPAKAMS